MPDKETVERDKNLFKYFLQELAPLYFVKSASLKLFAALTLLSFFQNSNMRFLLSEIKTFYLINSIKLIPQQHNFWNTSSTITSAQALSSTNLCVNWFSRTFLGMSKSLAIFSLPKITNYFSVIIGIFIHRIYFLRC